jgi:type II secretory pathway component PulM
MQKKISFFNIASGLYALSKKQRYYLGFVVIFMALLLWSWFASLAHLTHMRQLITQKQKIFSLLCVFNKELQVTKQHKQVLTTVALIGVLQHALKAFHIEDALTVLKQTSSETLSLHFKEIDFDKLILFLTKITEQYTVTIQYLVAEANTNQGFVDVDLGLLVLR